MLNATLKKEIITNNITLPNAIAALKKVVQSNLLNYYSLSNNLEAVKKNKKQLTIATKNQQYVDSLSKLDATNVESLKFLLKKYTQVQKMTRGCETRLEELKAAIKNRVQSRPVTSSFKSRRKSTPQYGEFMLFLKKRKNNFYINLHLYNGKLLYTNSVGKVHFKGPKRSTLYGLEELTKKTSMFLFENKINYIRIFITSKVNKKINRVIKLLKYHYPKLRYFINKVVKYQHSAGLKLKKLRRI